MSDRVYVTTLPDCDFCIMTKPEPVPALYDARTKDFRHHEQGMRPGSWANMCEDHWRLYGVGRLGTGFGQRLIVGEPPERTPEMIRAEVTAALAAGDFDAAEEAIGDGDISEWL